MKKFLAIALAGAMVMSMSTTVFATEIGVNGNQNAQTTVSYGPQGGYTVVIPESIVIDEQTNKGSAVISAENVMIGYGTTLNVNISGDDYVDAWELINEDNDDDRLEYIIGTEEGKNDIVNNSVVLASAAGDNWNSKVEETLYFEIVDDVTAAGYYEDILTFTVTID